MEYISAEEFLKQPKEVQQVFADWMRNKYVKGDMIFVNHGQYEEEIIFNKFIDENGHGGFYCIAENNNNPIWVSEYVSWIRPLFTEGQLRQFIEDKTKLPCGLIPRWKNEKIEYQSESFILCEKYLKTKHISSLYEKPIFAFWELALKTASTEVSNE
jgi:hypothetical protein